MTGQTLDPFGYWPNLGSRIRTLGGPDHSEDPNYIFHTSYVSVASGPSMAEVSFEGLSAESGMISVRIFQNLATNIPAVTEHGKTTALLPSIAKTERSIGVPFEAVPGATYAVTGYVFGECDARATAIDVQVAPRATQIDDPLRRRSLFGRMTARHVAGIATSDEPRLAWPMSQGFTPAQLREPDFARIAADLSTQLPDRLRWEAAYIVRVLEQYGRLEPGARGLALSLETDPAAAHVARSGCDIRSVILAPEETIADAIARALPDPDEARGFDFAWTRSTVFGTGGSARAIGMIEAMLERLRPGGLAIHLLTTGGEIDRHALNRISLGVASLGHIVAQLRYPAADARDVPFGIVVRKTTDDIIA